MIELNRRLVRCADDLVFYRDNEEWVSRFIKNRGYWIEPVSETAEIGGKKGIFSTHRIRERRASE